MLFASGSPWTVSSASVASPTRKPATVSGFDDEGTTSPADLNGAPDAKSMVGNTSSYTCTQLSLGTILQLPKFTKKSWPAAVRGIVWRTENARSLLYVYIADQTLSVALELASRAGQHVNAPKGNDATIPLQPIIVVHALDVRRLLRFPYLCTFIIVSIRTYAVRVPHGNDYSMYILSVVLNCLWQYIARLS